MEQVVSTEQPRQVCRRANNPRLLLCRMQGCQYTYVLLVCHGHSTEASSSTDSVWGDPFRLANCQH